MISPELDMALARAHLEDLRRAATADRLTHRQTSTRPPAAVEARVTLRLASASDEPAIERLAQLDSSTAPAHPVLIAEVDGDVRAALGLTDRSALANPFHATTDLVELLHRRARQLDASSRLTYRRRRRSWARLRALAGR
jgi:hypothetical protein